MDAQRLTHTRGTVLPAGHATCPHPGHTYIRTSLCHPTSFLLPLNLESLRPGWSQRVQGHRSLASGLRR